MDAYKKLGYVSFVDHFYTGPDLFNNFWLMNELWLVEPCYQEEAFPKKSVLWSSNNRVNMKLWLHNSKHVTLLSSRSVNTGRKHWWTKKPMSKPEIVHVYNKFMHGGDLNDQLLKFWAFSWPSLKWWKCFFIWLI